MPRTRDREKQGIAAVALARGATDAEAAAEAGAGVRTVGQWKADDPDFRALVEREAEGLRDILRDELNHSARQAWTAWDLFTTRGTLPPDLEQKAASAWERAATRRMEAQQVLPPQNAPAQVAVMIGDSADRAAARMEQLIETLTMAGRWLGENRIELRVGDLVEVVDVPPADPDTLTAGVRRVYDEQ